MQTKEQVLSKLELANIHRIQAAMLRREVQQGRISYADAVRDPRSECMTVVQVLSMLSTACAQADRRRMAERHVHRMLEPGRWLPGAPPSPVTRRRDLTPRQVMILADLVPVWQQGH